MPAPHEIGSKGLVLVDLDGTLIDPPSAERRFIAELMSKGFLGPAQWWGAGTFLLRHGARFRLDVVRKNKAYLAGLQSDRIEALAAEFVTRVLIPNLRDFMLERLQQHLYDAERVVLLTGAPDFLAAPLAWHLRLTAYCATVCHQVDGRFTIQPPVQHPFRWDKHRLAEALCTREGCVLEDSTAYADARHDLPLLDAVGRAVAVTPDCDLAHAALRRGWEILVAEPLYPKLKDFHSSS